jgi:rubredoxin
MGDFSCADCGGLDAGSMRAILTSTIVAVGRRYCGGPSEATIGGAIRETDMNEAAYKSYMCVICGFIYDEARGLPEEGFAPGTRWEDIPFNWVCPECGASKDEFEMIEI